MVPKSGVGGLCSRVERPHHTCLCLCQMLDSEKQKLYGAAALGVTPGAVLRNAVLGRLRTDLDCSQPHLIEVLSISVLELEVKVSPVKTSVNV